MRSGLDQVSKSINSVWREEASGKILKHKVGKDRYSSGNTSRLDRDIGGGGR